MKETKINTNSNKKKFYILNSLSAVVLIVSFLFITFSYIKSWKKELYSVFESFTKALTYPSWTLNKNLVEMALNTMIKKKEIISITVYDDKGEVLGEISKPENITILHSIFNLHAKFKEYWMDYKGFLAGKVVFEYSDIEPAKLIFIISIIFIALYFVIFLLLKNTEKSERLKNAISELNEANSELEIALSELEETQQRVINSEKMAVLGKLMINIAHDVNTPIGIIYSSLTDIKDRINRVTEKLTSEELTEEELKECLSVCGDLVDIMIRNAQRIRDLVQSLKRVAVNELTQTVSTVKIKDVVNDVLNAMHPKLRKTKVSLKVDVSDDLEMKTVPGAWAQILMNLIDNSIIHGFEYDNPGEIVVKFEKINSKVLMIFSDNGKGMNEETKRRAFEPFYTTDTFSGSGLGLSIVYQLVTELLRGEITLESEEGKGTTFKILVPCEI
ncbi:HAMP domain-containing sensor histidine kinase [Fervidobacterium sp. 2310opik-2]|uniref:sensor histidine kinase n=1 Tax=Fervidobacterium sp. 2310opik-2 TaxID=1755815 RepID=UPI0013DF3E6C|nr:HAMP domain-containing sensor histidine kinase [Fervidobacterium sp. 2310opik-2]KAF2961913.1 histidine kinase [Fervidobacterium sp. 2310opik-2]